MRIRFSLAIIGLAVVGLHQLAGYECIPSCDSELGNTAVGEYALVSNTTGINNTATGGVALFSNTTGNNNTANGGGALSSNTSGNNSTAIGENSLNRNTTGNDNTANGAYALEENTTGFDNMATGFSALLFNTTGNSNTASGSSAAYNNSTGSRNVAVGFSALYSNQIGIDNTATGVNALYYNTGNYNTATGYQALESNTTGTNNTANGLNALNANTIGSYNAAHGAYALYKNTAGTHNIALGYNAGYSLTTGSNNIDIGNPGLAAEANTIRIGAVRAQTNTYIAGISGVTVAGGVGVIVDSNGHLGTVVSSERFKDSIKPMNKASEAILALQPVTFYYKKELDPEAIPQFGLVAEEVEKVNPDLVAHDDQGKPYTVRYEAVNAMLLNEFLKEHRIVQEQGATIAKLQKGMEALTARLEAQEAQLQTGSGQLALSRPARVNHDQ